MNLKHRSVNSKDQNIIQLIYHLDKIKTPFKFHSNPQDFFKKEEDIFKNQTLKDADPSNSNINLKKIILKFF